MEQSARKKVVSSSTACRRGFLRQLLQETTGARTWNYKRCLRPLLLQFSHNKQKALKCG